MGGTSVGVLVGSGGGGRPLVRVAQRCEVAAVPDAGAALELLAHAVAVEDVAAARLALGGRMRREDL